MGPEGTFGKIEASTGYKSITMERPPLIVTHTCIAPGGPFLCEVDLSPAFYGHGTDYGFGRGMVYHVRNVPGRDNILLHSANWPIEIATMADLHHYQLEGCVALGAAVARIQVPAPDLRMLKGITSSFDAVKAFMASMAGEPFMLTIV